MTRRRRVVINGAILARGVSGTARMVEHMHRALDSDPGFDVDVVRPRWSRTSSRIRNLAADAYWDFWGAAHCGPRPDVIISPCNVGAAPGRVPHVLWLYDTMVLDHPGWFDAGYYYYSLIAFSASVRTSKAIATLSQYSAARIRSRWPAAPPVWVVPPPTVPHADAPRASWDGRRTVVMIAATEFHKNHAAAIDAVRIARLTTGEDLRLRLMGPRGRADAYVSGLCRAADPGSTWLSRRRSVPDADLDRAYAEAWALVQPSLDEGFGLPVIEAGAHAVPAVHSGRGALAEVSQAGNAKSVAGAALAARLIDLLEPARYREASEAALQTAGRFSEQAFRQRISSLLRAVAWS